MTSVNELDVMSASAARAPSRRSLQRVETRERIFQAALEEFRRVGFSEAQIPRIAAASGVVRGTFYFHFPSKEHVLRELSDRNRAELVGSLYELRGQDATLRDVLRTLMDAMERLNEGLGQSTLLRDVLAMYVWQPPEQEPSDSERGLLDELSHHFGAARERGELRRELDPERVAAAVLTSIFGFLAARRNPELDWRSELELLMRLLLDGMAR